MGMIFTGLCLLGNLRAMQDGEQEFSENYKHQYVMEYQEFKKYAVHASTKGCLLGIMEHEKKKRIDPEVLQARLDALNDLFLGRSNKFEDQS